MADFGKKETLVQKFLQALKPLAEMTGVSVEGQSTDSVAKLSETFAAGCEQVSAALKETAGCIREVGRVLEEMLQHEREQEERRSQATRSKAKLEGTQGGPRQQKTEKSEKKKVACFICEQNHYARDCPYKAGAVAGDGSIARLAAMRVLEEAPSDEISETVKAIEACLSETARGRDADWQSVQQGLLDFVETTVSGLKVSALVDTGSSHSLVSKKTALSLHSGMESCQAKFKAVNSAVRDVTGMIRAAPIRVGRWHGKMDLKVVPLDDHSMILGQDFLRLAKAVPVPHAGRLVFLGEDGTWSLPMTQKSRLGYKPRVTSVQVFEDPGKCKHLPQQSIGKKTVSAKNSKPSIEVKADLSAAGRLAALEKRMASISEEIDALCISEDPLRQHEKEQFSFPVACAKVANEGTLEVSCSRLGNDTSVEKDLDAESHDEVLAKAQVLAETQAAEETQVAAETQAVEETQVAAETQVAEETQVAAEMQVSETQVAEVTQVAAETQVLEEVLDGENTREFDPPRDAEDIVAFCIHAIGIPEKELTRERLQQVGCEPIEVDAVLAHLESKRLLEPVKEEVAKETMAKEAVAELCILQEQKLLACLETSRHIETCDDKASKPFEGTSKAAKKRAKKRSQQTKVVSSVGLDEQQTKKVSSVGLDDRTELAADMSTWTADGVGFAEYWARLKELSASSDAVDFRQYGLEDTGGGGHWHRPCLFA